MGAIASQITSLTIVYSTVYSGADQRKHQSSASLAFVRGIHRGSVNSPHKWSVTREMFPFDDVIMICSCDLPTIVLLEACLFRLPGIVVARVCVGVLPSVRKLVRARTHHPFKLESPHLDQMYKRPWLISMLFCGAITIDLL